ncbi:HAMP domain-containing sensor histidine kinase [Fusobacterium sp.]|uniref:sensor histidine kinase n=2 Tax=Fusobacterium sp. TaxID=68766 RepID=UPI00260C77BF|nr:HAMP domain-containing sensor histidine kinase [Fusobacterium sp.]
MMKNISFFNLKFNTKEFFLGSSMVLFSILLPNFLLPYIFTTYEFFNKIIDLWSVEYLIYSAFYLVFFNTLTLFPIFLSVFLLMDSVEIKFYNKQKFVLKILFGFLLIQIIYFLVYKVYYDMNYYFGKVAILEMIYIVIHSNQKFKSISLSKRNFVLFFIFIGIQWLEITKYFSILDFKNTSEIFFDLKAIAELLEASFLLDFIGFSLFFIFFIFSISLLLLFLDQEKEKNIYEKEKRINQALSDLAIQETENRYFKEIQYLVHDLKTPLFSISTLIEILELEEKNIRKLNYFKRIEDSLTRCNVMISEILNDSNKNNLFLDNVFNFIFSYLSTHNSINYLKFYNFSPKIKLKINQILFSRAIINLILNSYDAISNKKNGIINVIIKYYFSKILIIIEDNGIGIDQFQLKNIFNRGYSSKNSSGIGLNFVKTVIDEHKGKIFVISQKNKGTKFFVILGKECINYEK